MVYNKGRIIIDYAICTIMFFFLFQLKICPYEKFWNPSVSEFIRLDTKWAWPHESVWIVFLSVVCIMDRRKRNYKWCFIPQCPNTSTRTPEKSFFTVPKDINRRKAWFQAIKRKMPRCKSIYFCCEDHFNVSWGKKKPYFICRNILIYWFYKEINKLIWI